MNVQRFDRSSAPRSLRSTLASAGDRLRESHFLSREERLALEEAMSPPRVMQSNVDLVRHGQGSGRVFIVTEGWACRYAITRDGSRQLPTLLVPGDVANLDSLLFDRLNYGVRTLTQATVVSLPRDRALALAAAYPGIARTFTWLALVDNANLTEWTLSLGRRSAKERLAHLLCELSVRLDADDGEASSFAFPLTQEQIADTLGLTAVHVNRTMQQLRSDGLIVTASRTVTLPNVDSLRRLGGFDPSYLHLDLSAQRG